MNKRTDTLIIYGGGTSLNDISQKEYDKLMNFDSIAVNLFIKTKIKLTHYIVGEGLFFLLYKIDIEKDDKIKNDLILEYKEYINILNTFYSDTQLIFIETYDTMSFLNKYTESVKNDLTNKKIIFVSCNNEGSEVIDYITNKQLYHKNCGINCCINYGLRMGYKNIIFVGIDLYNSKYAYDSINSKLLNKDENQEHSTKNTIFKYIIYNKDNIRFFTYNPRSMLSQIIPTIRF